MTVFAQAIDGRHFAGPDDRPRRAVLAPGRPRGSWSPRPRRSKKPRAPIADGSAAIPRQFASANPSPPMPRTSAEVLTGRATAAFIDRLTLTPARLSNGDGPTASEPVRDISRIRSGVITRAAAPQRHDLERACGYRSGRRPRCDFSKAPPNGSPAYARLALFPEIPCNCGWILRGGLPTVF